MQLTRRPKNSAAVLWPSEVRAICTRRQCCSLLQLASVKTSEFAHELANLFRARLAPAGLDSNNNKCLYRLRTIFFTSLYFNVMEDSQYFVLEEKLSGLYECLDAVQKEFANLKKRVRPTKRSRPWSDHNDIFKRNISNLRPKWSSNFDVIFKQLVDTSTYDKIVYDILKAFQIAKIRYKIKDEHYGMVIKSICTCIVALIMDSQELSKKSAEIQARRLYFLNQILTMDLNVENSIDDSSDDSNIDIISVPTSSGTQNPTSTTCDENPTSTSAYETQKPDKLCQLESIYVLDVLFDALSRHTSATSCEDADLQAHIYHIVNITYVADILQKYLNALRTRIQVAQSLSGSPLTSQLRSAMRRYEGSLVQNLDKLGLDHPLVVFKKDVRKILFIVRLISSWLK